jgi:hypothetical protein
LSQSDTRSQDAKLKHSISRVDSAHAPANRKPADSKGSAIFKVVAMDFPADERLKMQAEQLAEHLRERQTELDYRESQIHARFAQMDSDMRAARLWLTEREEQLASGEERIAASEKELKARLERLAAVESNSETKRNAQNNPQQQSHPLDAEIRQLHQQLLHQRRQMLDESRERQERFELLRKQSLEELESKRRAVQRHAEQVDQSRTALRQMRTELARMHRETLELRLATEEVWCRLSGEAPPAALTQSLSRIRAQLAEHYAQANADLQRQRAELEEVKAQLSEQCQALLRQKNQFKQWAAEENEQSQRQAARLLAQERQLEERETEMLDRCRLLMAGERIESQNANARELEESRLDRGDSENAPHCVSQSGNKHKRSRHSVGA